MSRALALLGLLALTGCGARSVVLTLPEEIRAQHLPTTILGFEEHQGEGPRFIHALDTRTKVAPVSVELLDGESVHVTLVAMSQPLDVLALSAGELEPADANAAALVLPDPALVYSADLRAGAPVWMAEPDPAVAVARIRIAAAGPRTVCDQFQLEEKDLALVAIDLQAVLALPDGSALVGGGGSGPDRLGVVQPDLSLQLIPVDGAPEIDRFVPASSDKVYALAKTGQILVIDPVARRVERSVATPYTGLVAQAGGPPLAWTSSQTVELGPDLRPIRVRDDFPSQVVRVASDGAGGWFVMTSSVVLRQKDGVWLREFCCADFVTGKHNLFALGEEAMASGDSMSWTRDPETRRWNPIPAEGFRIWTVRSGAILRPGLALTGGTLGRLRVWNGTSWCDLHHRAESTSRGFNGIDADLSRGVFYAVSWFTGESMLPLIVRGTLPP